MKNLAMMCHLCKAKILYIHVLISQELQVTIPYLQNQHREYRFKFKSNNSENYNKLFTPTELKETIQRSHNTTIGFDETSITSF